MADANGFDENDIVAGGFSQASMDSRVFSATPPSGTRRRARANEHLRNILLLSQEIKTRKRIRRLSFQFSKQHVQALEFRITLMKLGNEGESIHIYVSELNDDNIYTKSV